MFRCRVALALGLAPSEVEQMPSADYELLARYWLQEPWGPWRDNLHAAIIARAVVSPHVKKGTRIDLADFMLRHPEEVAEEQAAKRRAASGNLFRFFKSIATKRPYRNG